MVLGNITLLCTSALFSVKAGVHEHANVAVPFSPQSDHTDLESLYRQYVQCRFQWLFTYWLFRQPPPFNRQLRSIYLQWRQHSKRKVASWGETLCDVRYLASLHSITSDYWKGKLAGGDETIGE